MNVSIIKIIERSFLMNYNYLRYFITLAKTEHYTHAAELLDITQPSLSHAMSQLEEELGIFLFEKQGRNIKLTKYGKIFYEYIAKAMNEINHGVTYLQSLASQDQGTIDLGFIYTLGSYYVPSVIHSFLENHQKINFHLRQGTTKDIIELIKNETLDIGFCSYNDNDSRLNFIPVVKEEIVVIVSKQHPLAHLDEIDLSALQDEKWIYYSTSSGLRPYIDKIVKGANVTPTIICEVDEDSAIFGLVDINYGIALVPNVKTLDLFNIKKINIKNVIDERFIYMVTLKNKYTTPSVNKFINYMMHHTFAHQPK